ncbi:MAG: hypothetical protein HXX08_05720 [Chloroflexi bacterium]|uniref:RsbT co-antagonist protein RsbRD N-terminal domain-containing protein n=1 Tax=Candidatus Chlorohelix allophototropha TaxID=3003348 RepID=A0A8T7M189_9CHLR|nr:hypothetical protein [Chloroflexota bacterium]WJW67233.1 hypothetical protein OZ401_000491 [Chloroflexota bacterium L227-S17]
MNEDLSDVLAFLTDEICSKIALRVLANPAKYTIYKNIPLEELHNRFKATFVYFVDSIRINSAKPVLDIIDIRIRELLKKGFSCNDILNILAVTMEETVHCAIRSKPGDPAFANFVRLRINYLTSIVRTRLIAISIEENSASKLTSLPN